MPCELKKNISYIIHHHENKLKVIFIIYYLFIEKNIGVGYCNELNVFKLKTKDVTVYFIIIIIIFMQQLIFKYK